MTIKTGDLVMVVKPSPCCGTMSRVGLTFKVAGIVGRARCHHCGEINTNGSVRASHNLGFSAKRLKKIDPPAEGDSLPTRADIEVAA